MRLPKATDTYDTTNEQQTRRALESAIDDIDGKLSSLLTSSGTLAANVQNLTAANGTNNDVALGYGTYTRITGPTASFTLTGLTGGESGRILLLRNTTAYDMVLANESGSSTAKNRILTQTGGNVTLSGTGGCSALLFYDGASERWILVTGDPLDARVAALEAAFAIAGGVLTYSGDVDGYVPVEQLFRLNADLAGANGTSVQSVFGVGCTLAASTVYDFEIIATLAKTAGTTSHTISLGYGGTATFNAINCMMIYHVDPAVAATATASWIIQHNTTTAFPVTSAITTANNALRWVIRGTLSVNTSGTFIPQYTLSAAPGSAYSTVAGSFMRIAPIGASGANTSIGTWA